jgi:outer membrane protein OmpA-like peptidoglycan-associated protein
MQELFSKFNAIASFDMALTWGLSIRQAPPMSEANQTDSEDIEGNIEKPSSKPAETINQPASEATRLRALTNPIVFLLFMIFVMILFLLIINFKNNAPATTESKDDPSITAAKADLEARRMEINRQRLAMNLPPIEGTAEPADDIASRLKRDADTLAALSESFRQMIADKNTQLSERNNEILRLEKLRQDISMENARLQSEISRALGANPETERLKILLADSQRQLAAANDQLLAAKNSFSEDEFNDLKRRLDETTRERDFYQARAKELEENAAKADLFANSEAELLPAAVELFRRLRKLEGHKDSDLTSEYSSLGVDLGAKVLHTLTFETGKSELSAADMEKLAAIATSEVPDGDLTLIIGYASETGNLDANQELSSQRATTAAEHFSSVKRPGQLVQAVYLGQTDRFSSRVPERNQICEVWRIRRK